VNSGGIRCLSDLMQYWYKHAIDEEHGAFYLNLSRDWKPMPPWDKMPSMISYKGDR